MPMSKLIENFGIKKQELGRDSYFYCIDVNRVDKNYLLEKLKNLPIDEQRRYVAYRSGIARKMFLCSRTVFREEFGHFGVPFYSKIKRSEYGKPYSKYYSMYVRFSVSHSGEKLIVGFSHSYIGVDVEKLVPWSKDEIMEYAHIVFHPHEIKLFDGLNLEESQHLYTRLWVIKESYVKFKGVGAGMDTRTFYVEDPYLERPKIKGLKENVQTLCGKTHDDYFYAVCLEKD